MAGLLGCAVMGWCMRRRAPRWITAGPALLGVAWVVALLAGVPPVDPWTAVDAVLLLLAGECAHAAAGLPRLDVADRASTGRYVRAVAAAALAGFGVAALLLVAAASGGSGGAEVTAVGVACAAAALGLLAAGARRSASP
jgi:peptidoglycan/LPS O-acetylase OafA/YrhL